MTTAHCAKLINDMVGEKIVDNRYIRQAIEAGELIPVNPNKPRRKRYRVTTSEFLRYVQVNHRELFDRMKQRLAHVA